MKLKQQVYVCACGCVWDQMMSLSARDAGQRVKSEHEKVRKQMKQFKNKQGNGRKKKNNNPGMGESETRVLDREV